MMTHRLIIALLGILLISVSSLNAQTFSYLGSYNQRTGVPDYLESLSDDITPDLLTYINAHLTEGEPVASELLVPNKIILNEAATVWVTFVQENADYKNALGFYINGNISDLKIIFPNCSEHNSGGELISGSKVKLQVGTFPVGTEFGWFLVPDGWISKKYSYWGWYYWVGEVVVKEGKAVFYSDSDYNPDGLQQCILFDWDDYNDTSETYSRILLAFEDMPNCLCEDDVVTNSVPCPPPPPCECGDRDFNDVIYFITVDGDYSLPVTLSYFTGEIIEGKVRLSWETQSETVNRGFILERQVNDNGWITLASYLNNIILKGQGTTTVPTVYHCTDSEIHQENSYQYKLSSVSNSGKTEPFPDIVKITYYSTRSQFTNFEITKIYPNPFNPATTIEYYLAQPGQINISVFNMQGEWVTTLVDQNMNSGPRSITWNADGLSSGVYFIHFQTGNQHSIQKCIFLK
ncbi:MAG: DUF4114 domain-containing protein [Candidatus Marinimicrobia bacterium]|nr:DUF4114 domain-containing protein [Candidatus Neomarinimicrobiota bacterium]